MNPCIVTQLRK